MWISFHHNPFCVPHSEVSLVGISVLVAPLTKSGQRVSRLFSVLCFVSAVICGPFSSCAAACCLLGLVPALFLFKQVGRNSRPQISSQQVSVLNYMTKLKP